jgi:DNA repair exonuclease SbcCD ATPase subunit
MTLNISQLQERLAGTNFYDLEQVNDSIIRSTRKDNDKAFAVYYFDISQELPWTKEKLTKYQDKVIGRHYFEGKKSLQWNNYLYFITSLDAFKSEELLKTKELIEKDRIYTRKFVISEEELDSVLKPKIVTSSDSRPHASIHSVWIDRLTEANIDDAVLCDASMPKRLEMIESSSSKLASKLKQLKPSEVADSSPFIRSLNLRRFRDYPIQREFEFGMVNLIFGPNGAGKTSLFEAIEVFYCGKNKRSGGEQPLPYNIVANLSDGRTEEATNDRSLQLFRDRNLTWYGQSEVKTTYLCQSFARFNFLDTDAAVSISDSASQIDDDLSKLLVGPDASKTWRNIERVHDAVRVNLKEMRPLRVQLEEELESIEKIIREASNVRTLSDSIQTQLKSMLHRIGWNDLQDEKESLASKLLETLSEFEALAKQSTDLTWIKAPISFIGIEKYCQDTKRIIKKAQDDVTQLEELQKKQKILKKEYKKYQDALEIANQAKRLIESGVLRRAEDIAQEKNTVAKYSDRIAGYNEDAFTAFSFTDIKDSILSNQDKIKAELCKIENLLDTKKKEYRQISELHDRSLRLSQELRQIATNILQDTHKPDECPLCHTPFAPGELVKRININIDERFEEIANRFLTDKQEREAELSKASSEEAALNWLEKFCEQAGLSSDTSVNSVISEVEKTKQILDTARIRVKALEPEMHELGAQGFSIINFDEMKGKLCELGFLDAVSSKEALDNLLSSIDQKMKDSDQKLHFNNMQAKKMQQAIEGTLGLIGTEKQAMKRIISNLNDKILISDSIRMKLNEFLLSFPWSGDKPIAELLVEIESIRKVSTALQKALQKEKQAKSNCSEGTNRKEQIAKKLNDLKPRIERLSKAEKILAVLREKYSLSRAMDTALQQNRSSIESIFSQIHSPAEFIGFGLSLKTLVRKGSNQEASLSEISTGQRAAFALSIFLAQNAHVVEAAPPVILIDDPIAHIDDLNSLSFLDYFREIALSGKKQIFFSTASDKLATLFERKFDFLGPDEFKKFNLERTQRLDISDMSG